MNNHHRRPLSLWLLFASLYTSQFIGVAFLLIALVAILREQGISLANLGLLYLLGLPWMFKFLWAPVIDRIRLPLRGHYRGWLLLTQALMVACLLVISQLSITADLDTIAIIGFAFVCCSATQDIATDALATTLFSHTERGKLNGIQSAGNLLGNLIGGGLILMLYPHIGWRGTFYLLATLTAVSWLQVWLLHEPQHAARKSGISAQTYLRLITFWRGRKRWLALLILYPAGNALSYSILTPMLIDGGWTLPAIGFAMNIFGAALGIAVSIGAGNTIQRFGRQRALIGFGVLQTIALLTILPAAAQPDSIRVYLALGAYFIAQPCATTILSTLMMDHAAHSTTPGSDFTLQFSVYMIVGFIAYNIALQLAAGIGYSGVIWLSTATACCATVLAAHYVRIHLKQRDNNHEIFNNESQ